MHLYLPIDLKSPLGYLEYLIQCERVVSASAILCRISDKVEPRGAEPVDTFCPFNCQMSFMTPLPSQQACNQNLTLRK